MAWLPQADAVRERLFSLGASAWALALAGLALSHLSRGARLRAEWLERGASPYLQCLRLSLQHATASSLLPFKSGELGYPWLLHRQWGIAWSDATASLLWLRLQDAGVLLWIGAGSLGAFLAWREGLPWAWTGGAALAVLCTAGMMARLLMGSLPRMLGRWQRRCRAESRGLAMAQLLERSLGRARGQTLRWCIAGWASKLGALAGLLAGLTDLTTLSAWLAAVSGELSAALPVQVPAGFGAYEAAVALAAGAVGGGSMGDLLLAALSVHLFTLVSTTLLTLGVTMIPMRAAPERGR